ncbi:hypothetical protein Tco_1203037 [Tanacetum coccineum]
MTTLQFADTHNLVAFLAKPAESEGFEQIVDFLNAHTIKYALTVNPTIYTSCIEQFWATVKATCQGKNCQGGRSTVTALVDGEDIVLMQSIRSDSLNDEEGMDCLPNATIFEELTRMGTIASAIICLATNQKFNFSKYIFGSMVKNLDNPGGGPRRQETMGDTIVQTRSENVSKFSNDLLLAREHKDYSSLGDYKFETESQMFREKGSQELKSSKDYTRGRYGEDIMFELSDLVSSEEGFVAEQGVLIRCELKNGYIKKFKKRQKRASTDTRTKECTKAGSKAKEWSSLSQTAVKKSNPGQQKSTPKRTN